MEGRAPPKFGGKKFGAPCILYVQYSTVLQYSRLSLGIDYLNKLKIPK